MNSLSGIKDVDREILLAMDDEDWLKTRSLNKYLFNIVCDDNFFYKSLFLKYPDTLLYYNVKKDKTYRRYYLKVIYYISKMKEDYNYSYISGNPKTQYGIFKFVKKDINNLLIKSSIKGELNLVKEAIKRGADIHAKDDYALQSASENGHLEVVKYLVENGADIHAKDERALRLASLNGHLQVVKYLVNLGGNIHIDNERPLIIASYNGDVELVKYLVSVGANIHVDNDAPIKWAAENSALDVVEYLKSLNK